MDVCGGVDQSHERWRRCGSKLCATTTMWIEAELATMEGVRVRRSGAKRPSPIIVGK
ncbi:hypothetical protein [Oryza sativa Japonica Group]|uniref:Uncharacterized protein n=1 Tax=Oryza sativa subsp. japonica TaxID=39947 RepID=Q5QLR8_ORYSJ|nr:hypothetical protein [Oryza sativa Japonica Group]BAD73687.1 hypothetical protein [Oryza sativa Japonica Group]